MDNEGINKLNKLLKHKERYCSILNSTREILICQQGADEDLISKYVSLINTALEYINTYVVNLNSIELPKFILKPNSFYSDVEILCNGLFIENEKFNKEATVIVATHLEDDEIFYTIVHELGHWLHYALFNNRKIQWYTEDLPKWGKGNNKEAFAEIFVQLFDEDINNKNTRKMRRLFNNI